MRPRRGIGFAVTSVLLGLLVVLGTIAVSRNEVRVDVTRGDRRTLSPQTLRVLEMVDRPIEVVSFYAQRPQEEARLADLVRRYREEQPLLSLRTVDPDRRPDLAEEYGVTANGTVVLADGELRIRMVDPVEAQLTAGLVRLLSSERPLVLFVTGHGEASLEDTSPAGWSQAAQLLVEQNFDVRTIATQTVERIPDDASLLVLAGPESDLTAAETDMITDYVLRGGRVLATLEPFASSTTDSLIAEFGIQPGPGFVVDTSDEQINLTRGGDGRIVIAMGGNPEHPITRDFTYTAVFPLARSLRVVQPVPTGVRAVRLLESQPEAWSERGGPQEQAEGIAFDPDVDRPGPLPLAYAVRLDLRRFFFGSDEISSTMATTFEMLGDAVDVRDTTRVDTLRAGDLELRQDAAESARLVVIGDTDFAGNANLRVQGNTQLLLASVLWLTEQEDRIALPPRPDLNDPVVLSSAQVETLRITALAVVPLVFLAIGAWTLWRRRQWV
jgi:ABC-type uncharacterized transport system involved in gliding motility auxiliary subunit